VKIQEILKQPESKTLEFKKEIPKNRQNLLKTVVAFANGAGGQKSEVRGQRSEVGYGNKTDKICKGLESL
jgi:hypothetical protein